MNGVDARQYNITVRFSQFEGEECYEARIKELPSVAEYADTYEEAYALAIDTIETLAEMYEETGKAFPEPMIVSNHNYSGRVTLRIPKSLHCTLTQWADVEEMSLNALMVSALSAYAGFGEGFKKTTTSWHELSKPVVSSSTTAEVLDFHEFKQAAS